MQSQNAAKISSEKSAQSDVDEAHEIKKLLQNLFDLVSTNEVYDYNFQPYFPGIHLMKFKDVLMGKRPVDREKVKERIEQMGRIRMGQKFTQKDMSDPYITKFEFPKLREQLKEINANREKKSFYKHSF